jgi:octopine/nopaline transport system permease protein
MDFIFLRDTFLELLAGVPLTIQLATISLVVGFVFAIILALFRYSEIFVLDWFARSYFFVFRGTPLLVQLFLIYYGLGQFETIRSSFAWTILREPYWCAIGALILNTAAYSGNILFGGLIAVPYGQIEAARACGMSKSMIFRRIMMPLAVRQALPGYSNEMISMVKATSLASIITLSEITGIASRLISESYRPVEVFIAAGAIYLTINFVLTRLIQLYEYYLNPRSPRDEVAA